MANYGWQSSLAGLTRLRQPQGEALSAVFEIPIAPPNTALTLLPDSKQVIKSEQEEWKEEVQVGTTGKKGPLPWKKIGSFFREKLKGIVKHLQSIDVRKPKE